MNCASTLAASGRGPKMFPPRTSPVPLSMFQYALNFEYAGSDLRRIRRCHERRPASRGVPALTAPQPHADRRRGLAPTGLKDAHRLHHDRAADRVVGRARRRVPRIEVAAEHDDFVRFISAGDFGDRVVRGLPGIRAVDDRELESDIEAIAQQPCDAAVMLVAEHNGRHRIGRDVIAGARERDDLLMAAARVVDPYRCAVLQRNSGRAVDLAGTQTAGWPAGRRPAGQAAGGGRLPRPPRPARAARWDPGVLLRAVRRTGAWRLRFRRTQRRAIRRSARSRLDLRRQLREVRGQFLFGRPERRRTAARLPRRQARLARGPLGERAHGRGGPVPFVDGVQARTSKRGVWTARSVAGGLLVEPPLPAQSRSAGSLHPQDSISLIALSGVVRSW